MGIAQTTAGKDGGRQGGLPTFLRSVQSGLHHFLLGAGEGRKGLRGWCREPCSLENTEFIGQSYKEGKGCWSQEAWVLVLTPHGCLVGCGANTFSSLGLHTPQGIVRRDELSDPSQFWKCR